MNPLERMALIDAEDEHDTHEEPATAEMSLLAQDHLPTWLGCWLTSDEAEDAITDAFSSILNAVRQCKEAGVIDIGALSAMSVATLEKKIAGVYTSEQVGAYAARQGVIAAINGHPVDGAAFLARSSQKLH